MMRTSNVGSAAVARLLRTLRSHVLHRRYSTTTPRRLGSMGQVPCRHRTALRCIWGSLPGLRNRHGHNKLLKASRSFATRRRRDVFGKLPSVAPPEELWESALSRTARMTVEGVQRTASGKGGRKGTGEPKIKSRRRRAQKLRTLKLSRMCETLVASLERVLAGFPRAKSLTVLQRAMVNFELMADGTNEELDEAAEDILKALFRPKDPRNLGLLEYDRSIRNAKNLCNKLVAVCAQYISQMSSKSAAASDIEKSYEAGTAAVEKCFWEGFVKQGRRISGPTVLEDLRRIRSILRTLPDMDSQGPTVVLCGMPNTGKSSLVRSISSGRPRVANFSFTTKGISVGEMQADERDVPGGVIQITDTPGVLNRNEQAKAARNRLELLTLAVLCLMDRLPVVVYVVDGAAHCGYSVKAQLELRDELHSKLVQYVSAVKGVDYSSTGSHPFEWIDVLSKADMLSQFKPLIASGKKEEAARQQAAADLDYGLSEELEFDFESDDEGQGEGMDDFDFENMFPLDAKQLQDGFADDAVGQSQREEMLAQMQSGEGGWKESDIDADPEWQAELKRIDEAIDKAKQEQRNSPATADEILEDFEDPNVQIDPSDMLGDTAGAMQQLGGADDLDLGGLTPDQYLERKFAQADDDELDGMVSDSDDEPMPRLMPGEGEIDYVVPLHPETQLPLTGSSGNENSRLRQTLCFEELGSSKELRLDTQFHQEVDWSQEDGWTERRQKWRVDFDKLEEDDGVDFDFDVHSSVDELRNRYPGLRFDAPPGLMEREVAMEDPDEAAAAAEREGDESMVIEDFDWDDEEDHTQYAARQREVQSRGMQAVLSQLQDGSMSEAPKSAVHDSNAPGKDEGAYRIPDELKDFVTLDSRGVPRLAGSYAENSGDDGDDGAASAPPATEVDLARDAETLHEAVDAAMRTGEPVGLQDPDTQKVVPIEGEALTPEAEQWMLENFDLEEQRFTFNDRDGTSGNFSHVPLVPGDQQENVIGTSRSEVVSQDSKTGERTVRMGGHTTVTYRPAERSLYNPDTGQTVVEGVAAAGVGSLPISPTYTGPRNDASEPISYDPGLLKEGFVPVQRQTPREVVETDLDFVPVSAVTEYGLSELKERIIYLMRKSRR